TLHKLDMKKAKIVAAKRSKYDGSYQALTLVNDGRQAVAAFHIDDVQDHTYGLRLLDVAHLESRGIAIDSGAERPVDGYRLAWSEDLQLGITPGSRGTGFWRVDEQGPALVDIIPCGVSAHATAIPGTRRVAVIASSALEVWELDPIALIHRTSVPGALRVAANAQPSFLVVGS